MKGNFSIVFMSPEALFIYLPNGRVCCRQIYVTVYRKTRHNAAPSKIFFLHLRSCRRPDIELSKFYCRSLSRSRYNRPNRSLPWA